MRIFLKSLIYTAALGSFVSASAVGGKFEKYIKFTASLVFICTLLSPLKNIDFQSTKIPQPGEFEQSAQSENADGLIKAQTEKVLFKEFDKILFENLGIKPVNVSIKSHTEENKTVITGVIIKVKEADRTKVGEFLKSRGCTGIEVLSIGEEG